MTTKIEIHGVRGLRSTPFRRAFTTERAMLAWCAKHEADIQVHGTRVVDADGEHIPSDYDFPSYYDLPRMRRRSTRGPGSQG